MAAGRIQGKEYKISEILKGDFIFKIPNYQRPYAWQIEQAEALLQDILSAIGDIDSSSDDMESYFLGSIVVAKEEHLKDAWVIDGQQRLTTLTILISVIRALINDQVIQHQLTKYIYEPGTIIEKTKDHFHLTLRKKDEEFFQEFIQKDIKLEKIRQLNTDDKSDAQQNIAQNTKKFFEILSNHTQQQLETLATYIVMNCFVIVVSTQTEESAFRIFTILNDRGLDLSYTDICKAEVIAKLNNEIQDSYTLKWESAEEDISREGFKDVLSHIRTIKQQARIKDTILKELRIVLENYKNSPAKFIDDLLVPYTEVFQKIRDCDFQSKENSEDINWYLDWLNRQGNNDWVPPAMVYLNRYQSDSLKILNFLIDLERLASSMLIRRENVNTRQTRYIAILRAIESGNNLSQSDSPLQLSKEEIQKTIARLDGDVYYNGARFFIMKRLDAELSENYISPNSKRVSIEHVLPQNPSLNSQWIEWYPDSEQRKSIVNRLGNLVLLSKNKNSAASNFEFDKKKRIYFKDQPTTFAVTIKVLNEDKWTLDVFKKRHEENLKALLETWRLEK